MIHSALNECSKCEKYREKKQYLTTLAAYQCLCDAVLRVCRLADGAASASRSRDANVKQQKNEEEVESRSQCVGAPSSVTNIAGDLK